MRESFREISVLSLFTVGASIALVTGVHDGDDRLARSLEWATTAGESALGHVGWGFGVYVPTLLGFYAIVIGGQLVASESTAGKIRRVLGFAAECMVAAILPALLVVTLACIRDPEKIGTLLVVLPVSGVMVFLAVQLGGFIVFERSRLLADAEQSRDWARERLQVVPSSSRRPPWLVLIANVVGAACIGTILPVATVGTGSFWVLLPAYLIMASGLVVSGSHALFMQWTARDRMTRIVVLLMAALVYLVVALACIPTRTDPSILAAGAGGALIIALVCVSSFRTRLLATPSVVDWSIYGATSALATQSLSRALRKALVEVDACRDVPGPVLAPLADRVLSAMVLVRTGEPMPVRRADRR